MVGDFHFVVVLRIMEIRKFKFFESGPNLLVYVRTTYYFKLLKWMTFPI